MKGTFEDERRGEYRSECIREVLERGRERMSWKMKMEADEQGAERSRGKEKRMNRK